MLTTCCVPIYIAVFFTVSLPSKTNFLSVFSFSFLCPSFTDSSLRFLQVISVLFLSPVYLFLTFLIVLIFSLFLNCSFSPVFLSLFVRLSGTHTRTHTSPHVYQRRRSGTRTFPVSNLMRWCRRCQSHETFTPRATMCMKPQRSSVGKKLEGSCSKSGV